MGHILKIKPVFKEMIWGAINSEMCTDTISPAITRENAGQSLPIKTGTVPLKTVNLRERPYPGCLKITENCSAISKEMNSRCW